MEERLVGKSLTCTGLAKELTAFLASTDSAPHHMRISSILMLIHIKRSFVIFVSKPLIDSFNSALI